jgi:hypothetical protein
LRAADEGEVMQFYKKTKTTQDAHGACVVLMYPLSKIT